MVFTAAERQNSGARCRDLRYGALLFRTSFLTAADDRNEKKGSGCPLPRSVLPFLSL